MQPCGPSAKTGLAVPLTKNQGKPGPVIAIVGAGFSGTMVACQLLPSKGPCLEVLLIDRAGSFGQGLAYGLSGDREN